MAVDIEEGGEDTLTVEGTRGFYVLSVVGSDGLEVSVFDSSKTDLIDLRQALETVLTEKSQAVLLRTEPSANGTMRWRSLEPKPFAPRLPKA